MISIFYSYSYNIVVIISTAGWFNDLMLDLMADAQEMDFWKTFLSSAKHGSHAFLDLEKNIEFFSPDISCPVDGCPPALVYSTKASFQRHWSEKHLPEVPRVSLQGFLPKTL